MQKIANRILHTLVGIAMVFSTLATALLTAPLTAEAAFGFPSTIGFQGRLKNSSGQAITSGTYDFRFRIYDAATTSGNNLTSTDSGTSTTYIYANDVTVSNGYFSTNFSLGADTPDITDDLYVAVEIATSSGSGASSNSAYEAFSTSSLIQLNKVPYAITTQSVESTDTQLVHLCLRVEPTTTQAQIF